MVSLNAQTLAVSSVYCVKDTIICIYFFTEMCVFLPSTLGPGKGKGGAADQRCERGLQLQTPGHRGEAEDHRSEIGRQEC